ncbi:Component of the Mediator complex [Teratosphaeria destructans]|uniref:Mediator of RNA polymerase II transcription subunit 1 n=1 Tax=Teratosphaeria destructans TaxID=418781 RepID=A0A9W7STL6_9PEZI|nr:Component of the Mediator complex [Teratosphaeria destructans]
MSTTPVPASGLPPHPGSASKKTAGHVTTPSHLGLSSPAPRSVPSPAATRKDQAIKTPINHPTSGSSQGSKTLGGTPMVQSLSQAGHNAPSTSPTAPGMSFGTPVGLGVDITPGQLTMPTPGMGMGMGMVMGMGGVPMNVTLSELGIGQPKRNEDEERRAKMRKVLKRIGKPKSRLTVAGLCRLAKRSGCEQINSVDASPQGISIAWPHKVIVDVVLRDDVPHSVDVLFDTRSKGLEAQTPAIAHVLLKDLQAAASPMESTLDLFAANIQRLAHVDSLSRDGVSCFDALSGLYESMDRLYQKESQRDKPGRVMKKKSGRPTVHRRRRVGLDLQYWSSSPAGGTAKFNEEESEHEPDDLHMLHLNVERCPATDYPAIRISETWLPDPLELPSVESGEGIPWQDPPPTLQTVPDAGNAMAVDNERKPPNVRFTATLDPPVVLPWQVANAVLQSVGVQHQLTEIPPAWHTAVVDPTSRTPCNDAASMTPVSSERQVFARASDGEEIQITHAYTLEPLKAGDASFTLEKMPFSHPRQLVEALPILRQWAFLSSLVRSTMAGKHDKDPSNKDHVKNATSTTRSPFPKASSSLADLLTPPHTPVKQTPARHLPVHIGFVTSPVPTLLISFPKQAATTLQGASVQVLPNAELTVAVDDGVSSNDSRDEGNETGERKELGRALEACGDLGVWIEWLRRRSH